MWVKGDFFFFPLAIAGGFFYKSVNNTIHFSNCVSFLFRLRLSLLNTMTDSEKAIYLNTQIGGHVHFYHSRDGESTAQILSVNTKARTFNCILRNTTAPLIMSFNEVIEFNFRVSSY